MTYNDDNNVYSWLEPTQKNLEKILNDRRLHAAATKTNGAGAAVPAFRPRLYIHKLEVVEKMTIYGYYPNKVPFVKVTLFNPLDVSKVVDILEVGGLVTPLLAGPCTVDYCTLIHHSTSSITRLQLTC